MKKICFFIGNIANSGGTERVTSIIANTLLNKNYNISILSLHGGHSSYFPLNPQIKTLSLFSKKVNMKLNYISGIFKLRQFIKKNNIDVLIDVDSILSIFSIPALYGLNIKHICWEHFNYNSDLGSIFRRIGRKMAAKKCDYIVTLTHRDKVLWKKNLQKINAEIIPINNPSVYNNIINHPKLNNKTVLAIGRLTSQKGFDLLLQAWELIIKNHSDWHLNIVGDGPDKEMLLDKIKHLNIQDSVTISPTTLAIEDFYKSASIYCLSSRFEGLPMVLLEAQSYGLPIVAFDCDTGPSDLIIDNVTGYLAKPLNIEDLAAKLQKLILIDSSDFDTMSQNAINNSKNFTIEKIVVSWVAIIQD